MLWLHLETSPKLAKVFLLQRHCVGCGQGCGEQHGMVRTVFSSSVHRQSSHCRFSTDFIFDGTDTAHLKSMKGEIGRGRRLFFCSEYNGERLYTRRIGTGRYSLRILLIICVQDYGAGFIKRNFVGGKIVKIKGSISCVNMRCKQRV